MSDLDAPLDELGIALSEIDVLAMLTAATHDEADWTDPDPEVVDAVVTLLGLVVKSTYAAMSAYDRLRRAVGDAQPAPASEQPSDKGEAMSAEDAAIIRRIRTQCPDRRFDGGTDAELLDLFRRNKRVLERGDEDVIAAMTRQK